MSPKQAQFKQTNKQTLSVSLMYIVQTNKHCFPNSHSSNKHWVSPQHTVQTNIDWLSVSPVGQYTHFKQRNIECVPNTHSCQFKQTLSVSPAHTVQTSIECFPNTVQTNKQNMTECLPNTHSSNKQWPLLALSVCSPQMEWPCLWQYEYETENVCVCVCVCVRECVDGMNLT